MILTILGKLLDIRLYRSPKPINFTEEELDNMWEDDVVDIHNFSHMDSGPAKDKMRLMLTDRRNWYYQQRLNDWAEQIDVALWVDDMDKRKCSACRQNDAEWRDRSGNWFCTSCAKKVNGCEICGSTSLMTREGEQLHYEEDCFK